MRAFKSMCVRESGCVFCVNTKNNMMTMREREKERERERERERVKNENHIMKKTQHKLYTGTFVCVCASACININCIPGPLHTSPDSPLIPFVSTSQLLI